MPRGGGGGRSSSGSGGNFGNFGAFFSKLSNITSKRKPRPQPVASAPPPKQDTNTFKSADQASTNGGSYRSKGSNNTTKRKTPKPGTSVHRPYQQGRNRSSTTTTNQAFADGADWAFASQSVQRAADNARERIMKKTARARACAPEPKPQPEPEPEIQGMDSLTCAPSMKAFQDCLNRNISDISQCQSYMEKLYLCGKKKGSQSPF